MIIDESDILNPGYYNEQKALACLLVADVCFLNVINIGTEDKPDWTTVVYVLANDTFAYACADAESISNSDGEEDSEIIALYKLWKEHSFWGPVKWLCIKRNMQPLRPIKEKMINDNYWDETLDALPRNYYEMSHKNNQNNNGKGNEN